MQKNQLKKNVGHRVRLQPPALRADNLGFLPPIDFEWIIESVNDNVTLHNPPTGHRAVLGFDHIHNYTSDPQRSIGGIKRGVLILRVQLTLKGNDVFMKVLERPGVGPARDLHAEGVERSLRQTFFYEMTLQGRCLIRYLLKMPSAVHTGTRLEQMGIAIGRGIVLQQGNTLFINPQLRPFVERVLSEEDCAGLPPV